MRKVTRAILDFKFIDDSDNIISWTPGQIDILDCIVNRKSPDGKKRVQIIAATRYGKSYPTAAAVLFRASTMSEKWAIVAGTKEKARIIMEYCLMFALNHSAVRTQLMSDTPLDRLRMRRSQDRLVFRSKGEIRVYSAESHRIAEVSKSLMGFGAPNVVEDESALVRDQLQATVMRMLGDQPDNFLVKIGNPFRRNHFLRTWNSDRYYKVFIDYHQGLKEGRYAQDYIEEMKEEAMFNILYECKFPEADAIDEAGWLPLLTDIEIERATVKNSQMFGDKRLGNDVAGGGRNFSVSVLRGYNVAKVLYRKNTPDTMIFVGNIVNFASTLKIKNPDIFVDKVGVGKGGYDRLTELKGGVVGFNGGESPMDKVRFLNLRAEAYWRAREWVLRGGKLEESEYWDELTKIKYKVVDSSGRLKIMSKEQMLKEGIDSPDVADAFSMTFARPDVPPAIREQGNVVEEEINFDPYD